MLVFLISLLVLLPVFASPNEPLLTWSSRYQQVGDSAWEVENLDSRYGPRYQVLKSNMETLKSQSQMSCYIPQYIDQRGKVIKREDLSEGTIFAATSFFQQSFPGIDNKLFRFRSQFVPSQNRLNIDIFLKVGQSWQEVGRTSHLIYKEVVPDRDPGERKADGTALGFRRRGPGRNRSASVDSRVDRKRTEY